MSHRETCSLCQPDKSIWLDSCFTLVGTNAVAASEDTDVLRLSEPSGVGPRERVVCWEELVCASWGLIVDVWHFVGTDPEIVDVAIPDEVGDFLIGIFDKGDWCD